MRHHNGQTQYQRQRQYQHTISMSKKMFSSERDQGHDTLMQAVLSGLLLTMAN